MSQAARAREQAVKDKARAYLAARASATLNRAMPQPGPALVTAEEIPHDVQAWEEAVEQVRHAQEILTMPAEAFLRYPLPGLGAVVGGVRPNRLHYYVSASNNGKTMFVYSFITAAIAAGQSCAVMTTETTAADFRMAMAAIALELEVGDIMTGEYLRWPHADRITAELSTELERWADYEAGTHAQLRVLSSGGYLTPESVRRSARAAADIGSDWFIIDHIDHLEGAGGMSEYQMSNAVNTAAWRAAIDLDLRVICTSQLNQEVFRQSSLGLCMHPEESWVKFGGKKKEYGWVMLSGSRVLRKFTDEDERKAELAAYKSGERTIADITLPCLMVRCMKHRDYGKRVGATVALEVRNGRVGEITKDTAPDVHGIIPSRDLFA